MLSASTLAPPDRASFATLSRLLACLVTESLLKAIFLTCPRPQSYLVGAAIILHAHASKHEGPYFPEDVFAVIPLRHMPIFQPRSDTEIGLLDPLDMHPSRLADSEAGNFVRSSSSPIPDDGPSTQARTSSSWIISGTTHASLTLTPGPLHLWKKFADAINIDEDMQEAVAEELRSSVAWQQYTYENSPQHAPVFGSPSIAWEQCIIEGHPTHPMHKARRAMLPIPPVHPGDYDWQHPLIRLVAVPRASLYIQGAWDDLIAPFCEAAARNAARPIAIPEDHTLIPVHALQIPNILEKFPDTILLSKEYHVEALAQQSLRSVVVPSALHAHTFKLALGVRLTSAMRTISPPSAFLGPHFSREVVPRLTYDRALLVVQRELASVSHRHSDHEIAKHLAGIVREAYENTCADHGECAIVCTALVETAYSGEAELPLVQLLFGLDTEEKRIAWLDTFVDVFFKAFLPSVIVNGVAFEAHPQNTLARFDMQTRELKGFVIRDFGGLRIHPPTLVASTDLQTLDGIIKPGHSIIAETLEEVYTRLYHTLIHNHLQQLIRVLDLHYNRVGWHIVRRRLSEQIPDGHELRKLWLSPESETLPGKSFVRMRLQGMYRTHLHGPFPNLIHYNS
ncbi:IucC family-domain-containing protein [Gautieria morchelliformis]|nr:IucC family-domain-containing protein [Gautieria morchelliformis]